MSHHVEHKVIVTGVPPASGDAQPQPYPRRPIEELVEDKKQFSLYVQAIDMLMNKDPSDMLSWFQISGIHGAPAQPWDNVRGESNSLFGGYCAHYSVLFPTWHRPYVLLFEQALVGCAVTIAERYTGADADEWKQAAISLRSPYWDWARNSIPPPEVIAYEKLIVLGPNGGEIILDPNPLLGYRFQDGAPKVDSSRPQTVRCPKPGRNVSDLPDLRQSLSRLHHVDSPMRADVWNTLTQTKTWEAFSNKSPTPGSSINSLETLHGTIHNYVGGGGQMSNTNLAAFDPIFWLHHTNVDRLLALWQALHPDVWVSEGSTAWDGNFTMNGNTDIDENTDLTPFWSGATSFFKSSSPGVRHWQHLNYDYPEFVQIAAGTDTRTAIAREVNRLYQDSISTLAIPRTQTDTGLGVGIRVGHSESSLVAADAGLRAARAGAASTLVESTVTFVKEPAEVAASHGDDSTPRLDWFARIRVQANKVGSSFSVLLFVGEPPEHEHDWRSADNLIGIHGEFVNSRPDQCENCQENAEALTEGFIGLTRVLYRRGLYGRAEREIEEYLSGDLEWRVQKTDATIVAASEVPGLEIAVMTVPLEFSQEWQDWVKCDEVPTPRDVTSGRAGGCPLRQQ